MVQENIDVGTHTDMGTDQGMVQDNRIIVLTGPTGSGKTGLALALARRFPLEIVNCDASQFYAGMDIGTAAPSAEELAVAPHHLFGICAPDDPMNAGRYLQLVPAVFADIWARGRVPLVVGGTGLYVRALTKGLASIPAVPADVREALATRLQTEGLPSLRSELERLDPDYASRIAANDPQRTLRALEVYHGTGRPLSAYQAEHAFQDRPYRPLLLGVDLPDDILRPKLARRVDQMFAGGFIEEAKALLAQGYPPHLRSFKALGYEEVFAMLAGELTLEEAKTKVLYQHIQYMRRQRTWFRKEPGIVWGEPGDVEGWMKRVAEFIED